MACWLTTAPGNLHLAALTVLTHSEQLAKVIDTTVVDNDFDLFGGRRLLFVSVHGPGPRRHHSLRRYPTLLSLGLQLRLICH